VFLIKKHYFCPDFTDKNNSVMQQENIFREVQQLLERTGGDLHVVEQRVPVQVQTAYFEYSEEMRGSLLEITDDNLEELLAELNAPEVPNERKKYLLSSLAVSRKARAYTVLKAYAANADAELDDWANLALMESRITLETELSDERQIYISTGMGGEGDCLRFYVLLPSAGGVPFADYQRQVLEREVDYFMSRAGCRIERVDMESNYMGVVMLIPIRQNMGRLLNSIIDECNQYGGFVGKNVYVTNVQEPKEEEIARIINHRENTETES
jgi:hypothetical protein